MATSFVESRRNVIPTDIRSAFKITQGVCLLFVLFLVIMLFANSSGAEAELIPAPQNLRIIDGVGGGSELTLAWDAVGSAVLAGYNVYWGLTSYPYDNMRDAGRNTTYTITGLPLASIYSAVTAYGNGIESAFSNEVKTVPIPPSVVLLGTGILGLGLWGRQRKRG